MDFNERVKERDRQLAEELILACVSHLMDRDLDEEEVTVIRTLTSRRAMAEVHDTLMAAAADEWEATRARGERQASVASRWNSRPV